jgi:death on curing protein
VEEIHGVLVSQLWPGNEPVAAGEFRDRPLLDSATSRPFQTAFGQELHKSVFEKAAALFHALIANHPFTNGNKRTAVLSLDHFLLANGYFLALGDDEMYRLAKDTASYRERAIPHEEVLAQIVERLRTKAIPFRLLKKSTTADWYQDVVEVSCIIRGHKLNRNQPSVPHARIGSRAKKSGCGR